MSLKQMRFQVTLKLIRPNSWITQTVRQRIPNCSARNGESTSAESAATDAWNDELTATGGSQAGVVNGGGTNFGVGVGEARPEGPRAGDGVLGEGTASPTREFAGEL